MTQVQATKQPRRRRTAEEQRQTYYDPILRRVNNAKWRASKKKRKRT